MGGIGIRLGMLGHQVQWKTFNQAVKIIASSIGEFRYKIIGYPTDIGPNTCEWCEEHVGREYKQNWFMPNLPKHPNCRHYWDIMFVGEKK